MGRRTEMRKLCVVLVCSLLACCSVPAAADSGPPVVVWVFGHSIPAGYGTGFALSWPGRLAQLSGGGVTVRVFAVGGTALDDPSGDPARTIAAQVQRALVEFPDEIPARAIIDAGTNDLVTHDQAGLTASKWAAINIDVMLGQRGVDAEWSPILPMGYGSAHPDGWLPTLNARAAYWNAWLVAMNNGGGFRVVNLDNVLGVFPVPAWLMPDGLHPSAAGALLIAGAVS